MARLSSRPSKKTLAVDFDGVIHAYSRGWVDGTIYDEPVPGCREGLSILGQQYRIVVFTARHDLPAVRSWLIDHKLDQHIADVTNRKPAAIAYIDDRAVRFYDWHSVLEDFAP